MLTGLRKFGSAFHGKSLSADFPAALISAVAGIPDSMASAVLAGVNPVHGLYALMVGPASGALAASSVFMTVTTTSAMSLATGAALPGDDYVPALITLTILVGVFQLLLGLFRFGFLVRYISNAVMTGFLSGAGVLIILGQLSDLTGYISEYPNKVLQAVDLILHLGQVQIEILVTGLLTIFLILVLDHTRARKVSILIAMVMVTAIIALRGGELIPVVGDQGSIPASLPGLSVPDLSLIPGLVFSAAAVGVIGLVQGAGVSQTYPNPDGHYPNISKDFAGQGIANAVSGVLGGIPVGGSISGTALVVASGAKTRLANLLTGVFVLIIIVLLAPFVERIPMPALAGLLLLTGIRIINVERISSVWNTGLAARAVMLVTFLATLALPLQVAIGAGVALSFVMHIIRDAEGVRIKQVVLQANQFPIEQTVPGELPSNRVTILLPYGSLFFASARTFEDQLPSPDRAVRPVVILLLRGRRELGSTFVQVIDRYARLLQAQGGKLILSGVSERLFDQMVRVGMVSLIGRENIYPSTSYLGAAANQAARDAEAWLSTTSG